MAPGTEACPAAACPKPRCRPRGAFRWSRPPRTVPPLFRSLGLRVLARRVPPKSGTSGPSARCPAEVWDFGSWRGVSRGSLGLRVVSVGDGYTPMHGAHRGPDPAVSGSRRCHADRRGRLRLLHRQRHDARTLRRFHHPHRPHVRPPTREGAARLRHAHDETHRPRGRHRRPTPGGPRTPLALPRRPLRPGGPARPRPVAADRHHPPGLQGARRARVPRGHRPGHVGQGDPHQGGSRAERHSVSGPARTRGHRPGATRRDG